MRAPGSQHRQRQADSKHTCVCNTDLLMCLLYLCLTETGIFNDNQTQHLHFSDVVVDLLLSFAVSCGESQTWRLNDTVWPRVKE